MPAKVTLRVVKGEPSLLGKEYPFEERTTALVGRHKECNPQIPDDEAHRRISRHHCLLDINPPDVRIRDFGSKNGTYVNGLKIGQRAEGQSPEDAAKISFPEFDLKDGDVINLAETEFRVAIVTPTYCTECSKEIPDEIVKKDRSDDRSVICESCSQQMKQREAQMPRPPSEKRFCTKCGKDISNEVRGFIVGPLVCSTCKQSDIGALIRAMIARSPRDSGLRAVEGYTLERLLGRGGMGEVHLARHNETGEHVALKVMLSKVAVRQRMREIFEREIEVTKAMNHPNVVQFHDSGYSELDKTYFFTVEYCDGGSVDSLMKKRGGKISVDEALQIVFECLDGLEYAHHAKLKVKLSSGGFETFDGAVHRDLKPPNILLKGEGSSRVAKITDFGLGKAFDAAGLSGQTMSGDASAMGTLPFMPRQQLINFKYTKPEVDVWAMAATLYNMLTGAFPRNFVRGVDPFKQVLETRPISITERGVSIPNKLAAIIDEALIDKPNIHFQSAADFKRALERAL